MISELFSNLRNLDQLIAWAGYGGMTVIIFAETGLLAGFFYQAIHSWRRRG